MVLHFDRFRERLWALDGSLSMSDSFINVEGASTPLLRPGYMILRSRYIYRPDTKS